MARTTTRLVVIDEREFKIAKLTLGDLRDIAEEERNVSPADPFGFIAAQASAVVRSIKRADATSTLTVDEFLHQVDAEDLRALRDAVMELTKGKAGSAEPPAGETPSP